MLIGVTMVAVAEAEAVSCACDFVAKPTNIREVRKNVIVFIFYKIWYLTSRKR
jgi:hypothetical protein